MSDFVQLWVYLSSAPLFGLTATLIVYVIVQAAYERLGHAPWANPVLWTVLALGSVLLATGTPYQTYFAGAQFVHVLLGPAVVALGWPLWQRRGELRGRGVALLAAATLGGSAAAGSAVLLAWALDLPADMILSLAPKSTTAPVAMGIAERLGGIPALAAVFAVLTGLVGALSGKYLFDLLGIRDWGVRGFALGTASHGIGAARALQVHPEAGAYAGIALGLQVLIASLLLPLAAKLAGLLR
ncbi:LrgB family protein [Noviherbaspirillum suwonense]|uniref:Effector of murein hydrolase n=1 Tax=Noviherbaspirillum suwonense TaxID=1224511 RepID=A0ABY1Q0A8_9BURK|nr:LrgB family protein [Noviherbaspirillum suwonense]SMP51406.1 Putative effector of murein hydrolase [Noviherbaspirillum suwonense]